MFRILELTSENEKREEIGKGARNRISFLMHAIHACLPTLRHLSRSSSTAKVVLCGRRKEGDKDKETLAVKVKTKIGEHMPNTRN